MIELPDFDNAFDHENAFYLTCQPNRVSKILAHYELYKQVLNLPGAVVECGVFKGASLARFAMFRELFGNAFAKKIIGFDTFGPFPQTDHAPDKPARDRFVQQAGEQSIDVDQLRLILDHKGCGDAVELIAGDVCETVPAYLEQHPELRVSLINLDTDIYEPAVTVLEHLYPRLVQGGVLVVDDYGIFPGETKAVDDYFAGQDIRIQKHPFSTTPSFIVKP